MPENLDPNSLTSDPIVAGDVEEVVLDPGIQEPEPPPKTSDEKYVPLSELIDERHARQLAQNQLGSLQNQQVMLQQQMLEMRQAMAPKGQPLDPEIQKLLEPYMAPLQDQLRVVTSQAQQAQATLDFQQKVAYLREHLPNFDALGPEIAKEIQKMDPSEQEAFLSSPRALVRIGKAIEKEMGSARAATTRTVARAAGRTETGATAAAASADGVSAGKDWMDMSSEEFNNDPRVKAMLG